MNQLKVLFASAASRISRLSGYVFPVFICLVVLIYGFLLMRITVLSRAEPDSQTVGSQVSTARVLRVDPEAVKRLNSLQDNSVNVQALFDQARENPFQ